MIKRPKLIWVVAIWVLFQQAFSITTPLRLLLHAVGLPPVLPRPAMAAILIAEIVILVGLVQMRKTPRLIAKILLCIAAFVCGKIFAQVLISGVSPVTGQPYPIQTYISFPAFIAGDILAFWYLSRKSVVELSRRFREQAGKNREEQELAKANAELMKNPPKL